MTHDTAYMLKAHLACLACPGQAPAGQSHCAALQAQPAVMHSAFSAQHWCSASHGRRHWQRASWQSRQKADCAAQSQCHSLGPEGSVSAAPRPPLPPQPMQQDRQSQSHDLAQLMHIGRQPAMWPRYSSQSAMCAIQTLKAHECHCTLSASDWFR